MKAMILAAGLGTRLRGATATRPKCLMVAGGKTMLQHTIERLLAADVTELVINLHHFPELVEAHLKEHDNFGMRITLSHELELLDTGGGLKKVRRFFEGEPLFFLHNCDVYTDYDLQELAQHHTRHGNVSSLLVMDRPTSRHLLFDAQSHLAGWENKQQALRKMKGGTDREEPPTQPLAFCGIQTLSPRIFDYMEDDGAFSIIKTLLAAASAGETVEGIRLEPHYWIDIGTQEKLSQLRTRLEAA